MDRIDRMLQDLTLARQYQAQGQNIGENCKIEKRLMRQIADGWREKDAALETALVHVRGGYKSTRDRINADEHLAEILESALSRARGES